MTTISKNNSLAGKRAIVIGGSRGIGAAIAKRLAAEGANVALTYASSPDAAAAVIAEIGAAGRTAYALKADSTDVATLQKTIAEVSQRFGGLDILVNNAGLFAKGMLDSVTVEQFDAIVSLNLRSTYFASQEAARHMQKGGRIINIGSNAAERSSLPGGSLYTVSKSGVAAIARSLARELGPRGITINTIQPGPTETDANPGEGPHMERMLAMLPIGRMGQPSEVAGLVAYLAADEAANMNGATLTMDGGMSV